MTLATFIEQCHEDYNKASSNIVDIRLNLPEELGDEMYIDADEPFVWAKVALIRKHVREAE